MTLNVNPMKKADLSRLETLEALIAEKRKQETFLSKLEERRAGTPEHVFNRLRDEYLTKLTDAQVKAAAEAETLSSGLEDDDAAVAEVEARLAALVEERVEMQLRAEIEEWDAKEAQKKLTAMTAAISMAEKERDARKTVAERTRALLTEARGGAKAPAAAQPPAGERPPMRPTTAAMAGGPNFDELAFLNSVVGRASTPSAPAPRETKTESATSEIKESPSAPKPVAEAPRAKTPSAPAAAVAESVAGAVPASPAPAPPPRNSGTPATSAAPIAPAQPSLELEAPKAAATPAAPAAPAAAGVESAAEGALEPPAIKAPAKLPEAAAEKAAEKPAAEAPAIKDDEDDDGPPSVLGRPTPRTSQAVKTLKCAECGSMNYPTEWYCERCGGELAAL